MLNTISLVSLLKRVYLSTTTTATLSAVMANKKALVVIAEGSEEIETVTPIDVLRRAGVEVTVAGLHGANIQICSRQVIIGVESSLQGASSGGPYDAILLPGGAKGAEAFVACEELGELLREQDRAGRIVASICAGRILGPRTQV
jgi:protein DJ-1